MAWQNTAMVHRVGYSVSFLIAIRSFLISVALVFALLLASVSAHASDWNCQPTSLAEVQRLNKLYVFEVTTLCRLNAVVAVDLVNAYKTSINNRENVNVLSENDIIAEADRREATVSIVEEVKTEHGDMTIYGNINITRDRQSPLVYKHKSGKIVATGATANTKNVVETVRVSMKTGDYLIEVSKLLHIKKPWYAPSGIFKKEVYKGLSADMLVIIDRHLRVLSGK